MMYNYSSFVNNNHNIVDCLSVAQLFVVKGDGLEIARLNSALSY